MIGALDGRWILIWVFSFYFCYGQYDAVAITEYPLNTVSVIPDHCPNCLLGAELRDGSAGRE